MFIYLFVFFFLDVYKRQVYIAPILLGDAGRGLCTLPGLEALSAAPRLDFRDVRKVGDDLRLTLTLR
ncbi:hypothetical protein BFS13_04910 [Pantoea sp. Ae16]|nr:hypothetical protein BFS13_04910 [Pantoea sp. Ae16]